MRTPPRPVVHAFCVGVLSLVIAAAAAKSAPAKAPAAAADSGGTAAKAAAASPARDSAVRKAVTGHPAKSDSLARKASPTTSASGRDSAAAKTLPKAAATSKQDSGTSKIAAKPLPDARPAPDDAADIPVEKWGGKRFVLLRMPPAYQQFGYELYATDRLAKPATPISAEIELPSRRLRYERFVGRTLRATMVTRPDSEYLVRFIDESSDLPVFGKTRQGAIKGLALIDDVELARQRWIGKTVYSHRGHYNTADSACSTITTHRVSMDAPLKVLDVTWGVSPMPPQVIWVLIETADRKQGFIPTFFSWTNVMTDSRKAGRPWQDDILEVNPATQHTWDKVTWDMVNEHKVGQGMTAQQVWLSWGEPLARDSAFEWEGRKSERWTYPAQYVVFQEGKLAATVNRQ